MTKKSKGEDDDFKEITARLYESIPFLLAGLTGHIDGVRIHGLSVQRTDNDDWRCILRIADSTASGPPVHFVSFTNGVSPSECIARTEVGFGDNSLRWHFDQYSKQNRRNGSSKGDRSPRVITR